jgi:hypothetical protein
MRVDALAIALRPRPMGEAADLGQRLVQTHARSVWRCYAPVWAAVLLLALATVEIAGWLPGLIVFWLKPWLDRTLLFVLSRAVFGESTQWRDLWAARREVFFGRLIATLTVARLSPWRAFTQPIAQLEGQRGGWRAAGKRRAVLLASQRGAAAGLQFVYSNLEMIALVTIGAMLRWFLPDSATTELWQAVREGESAAVNAAFTIVYGAVVLAIEPFYVASGFAMYLNRRVELEAWDIEQELRHAFA